MKKIIYTEKAPAAIGPYSQGINTGKLIFTSGQIPIDPENGEMVTDDIKKAAERCILNLKAVLEAADSSLKNVIKTTVFIKNMDDFAAVNQVYGEYFTENYPARSCVEVSRLPKDALVEIEAVAKVNE
ncbi:MAG: RidA family protein [Bacillota bacterium]|nr:RidA family protein [Bacillota bacterium]